ncbi:hypothetical protein TNCV_632591 [Trichonephila clavipes]|nr:hypothetical protein TNCV_632591 [Trichonephila clavipes]
MKNSHTKLRLNQCIKVADPNVQLSIVVETYQKMLPFSKRLRYAFYLQNWKWLTNVWRAFFQSLNIGACTDNCMRRYFSSLPCRAKMDGTLVVEEAILDVVFDQPSTPALVRQ